jgi:hypothetical protein
MLIAIQKVGKDSGINQMDRKEIKISAIAEL